jgi:hypothetical protein
MYYKYTKTTKGPQSWIDFLQTVDDLGITAVGKFTIKEVHFTKPKKPGTKASDFVNLPHITIEDPNGKKIHWYIWKQKLDKDKRIEEMMGNKIKTASCNLGEFEMVEKVMADIVESAWLS